MSTLGLASIAAVQQYLKYAEGFGIDLTAILKEAGISAEVIDDSTQRLAGEQFEQLLSILLEDCNDPLFGLHCSRYVQPGSYSVLGYITMNCATLGEAIRRIVPYEKLVGDMGTSSIEYYQDVTVMHWQCHYDKQAVVDQMVDNCLASWLTYGRWITDGVGSPIKVCLSRSTPSLDLQHQYQDFFGCPIYFEQPENALYIKNEHLLLPLRQADKNLLKTLEEHARSLIDELNSEQSVSLKVRFALKKLLRDGIPRKDIIAEQLAMTPRTMQRKLMLEHTSYQQILDQLRKETACHFLLETNLPITDIAVRLGFSEPRSFHRSFKQWTDTTPGEYRLNGAIPDPDGQ